MTRKIRLIAASSVAIALSLMSNANAQTKQLITPRQAVEIAEKFILENVTLRHGVGMSWLKMMDIQPKAYAVFKGTYGHPNQGWAVVFQHTEAARFVPINSGRVVWMDDFGDGTEIKHKEIDLSAITAAERLSGVESQTSETSADKKKNTIILDADCPGPGPLISSMETKARFESLSEKWQDYLLHCSGTSSDSKSYTYGCPAFKSIVEMGEPAVPLIMEKYLKPNSENWWTVALEDITGIGRNSNAWEFQKRKTFWSDWWDWKQGQRTLCPKLEAYDPLAVFARPK